jgi:hypothetical protein
MRRLSVLVLLCVLSSCTGDAALQGDVLLRRTIRLGNAPDAQAGFMYWGARTRVSDDLRKRLIFDLDAKTVTFADKRTLTYIVRTLDEVVRKRDQRRRLRGADATKITLTRTDKTERIAGYETREYTFAKRAARGSVWVSDNVRPAPAWREWEGVIAYLEGAFAGGEDISEAVAELNKYPLRTTLTFGEGADAWTITTQVAEIVPGAPAEDFMAVPPGFQRATDLPIPD